MILRFMEKQTSVWTGPNTDFHRFLDPCTDEGAPPEKGKREKGKKTRKQKRKALRTLQVKSRGGGSELCTVIQ